MNASVPDAASRRAWIALAATLAIQIYTSLVATAVPVLAPVIAPVFGRSPELVGVFVGLLYAGSMGASLVSGAWIARHGAIRVSQASVLLCAGGIALLPAAAMHPALFALVAVAPLVVGTGYGPITPASSQVLARTAPPSRMGLTFSIKQTGVPAGAALAGATLPALALAWGWRAALVAVALLGLVVALVAQRVRSDLDRERERGRSFSLAGAFAPLRRVFGNAVLAELAVLSFFYAAAQLCLTSFLVVFLTETLKRSLVAAGFTLAVATLGGVVGRVLWGAIADRSMPPRRLLGLIGIGAGACALLLASYPVAAGAMPLLLICAAFGATAIGWNGVQLAEIARHAPEGEAGAITGAAGFVTFAGVVCGPPLFALLSALTGSHRSGFLAAGSTSLLCGAVVLFRARSRG